MLKIVASEIAQLAKIGSALQMPPLRMSGARMVVQALEQEGVKSVWGYPGGAVLPIYDALGDCPGVEHLLVRHEQAAVHAADGFARATGQVGVALVTSGPGLTNAVTGIATAYFDSIPVVLISANVPSDAIGTDAFQECDATGITRSIVKHSFLVRDVRQLASTLKKAFHIARTGRPGPVHVDIPKDILTSVGEFVYDEPVAIRSYRPGEGGHAKQILRAAMALATSKRPCLLVGGGAIAGEVSAELMQLAEIVHAPVAKTPMALGAFPGTHVRCVGMPGMHGTYEANMALQHCDVLVAIGARFDDRVIGNIEDFGTIARTIIHIDIDPATISKRVKVDIPVVGHVKAVLGTLLKALQTLDIDMSDRATWWSRVEQWKTRKCLAFEQGSEVIQPQYVIQKLWEVTRGEAYVCSDVGQHQMWAAQHYAFDKPRRWINSGGLGTMGVGLPYAMGVKRAFPDADVATITGDGSIQMCIQELSTCKQYGLDLKIVSLNNGYLGMVRQLQHVHYASRYSNSYMEALPDFPALARAYGHVGIRVDRPEDVEPALREAFSLKGRTVFLDCVTNPDTNVWPMVPAGAGLGDMLFAAPQPSSGPAVS